MSLTIFFAGEQADWVPLRGCDEGMRRAIQGKQKHMRMLPEESRV